MLYQSQLQHARSHSVTSCYITLRYSMLYQSQLQHARSHSVTSCYITLSCMILYHIQLHNSISHSVTLCYITLSCKILYHTHLQHAISHSPTKCYIRISYSHSRLISMQCFSVETQPYLAALSTCLDVAVFSRLASQWIQLGALTPLTAGNPPLSRGIAT